MRGMFAIRGSKVNPDDPAPIPCRYDAARNIPSREGIFHPPAQWKLRMESGWIRPRATTDIRKQMGGQR